MPPEPPPPRPPRDLAGAAWSRLAPRAEEGWAEVFRRAPIGVLVLGALLFFAGAGFIFGAVFFALSGTALHWFIWLLLLAVGPLFVYVALHLVMLQRWAWLAVVTLLALLLLSSLVRTLTAEGAPIAPLAEVVIELASLAYLSRPRVRGVFGAG